MKIWNEVWDYVKMFVIVIVVVLVVNNVVLINAKIPSESMEQTIMTGDRIFGFRMAYGINFDFFGKHISKKMKDPERYDIIIFKYPDDESQLFIKRLIGLPGMLVDRQVVFAFHRAVDRLGKLRGEAQRFGQVGLPVKVDQKNLVPFLT